MPKAGFEPAQALRPLDPEPSVSASSTTSALKNSYIKDIS